MARNSFGQAIFTFAFVLIGLAMITYVAHESYEENANQDLEVIETLHPLMETVVGALPVLLLAIAGVAFIGLAAWFKGQANSGGASFR